MSSEGKKYDVVIIGSGLGGMVCGTILSKEGKRVCVIEKNEQIGGSLQTFKREGVTFDTGVHYIGGLSKENSLYKIFNYLGIMNRLETVKMDEEGFDVVIFKDDEQEYSYGKEKYSALKLNTEQKLKQNFPNSLSCFYKQGE